MSDLDTRPEERVSSCLGVDGPEELLITARRVYLGKTTEVARALPDRQIRMIGAWCFLDHYGPEDVSGSTGMQVWAHPHTGLQTVSWLFDGAVEHRDSLGSLALVRPAELNIMTAGHGVVHSEISPPDKPAGLHGVQLWVALPEAARDIAPAFRTHAELPVLRRPGLHGQVLLGEVDGVRSPAPTHSPLAGADLVLEPGADTAIALDQEFEYGVFVVAGSVSAASTTVSVDQLLYLGTGRDEVRLASDGGGRLILLGGRPFTEEIVMWWNFVGRSHDEIVAFRAAWAGRDPRFPPVVEPGERVMEAPPLPTVQLRPRGRRTRSR
jgi:redox-sensitive bicupin YhaK (pirin superfamily)